MKASTVKNCNTCDKRNVCKYVDQKKKLDSEVNNVLSYVGETPFLVSITCNEHMKDVRERSFA